MRLIINGQQAFGEAVLRALVKRGEEVVAVYCAPDKAGGKPDPLRLAAEELGLPLFQPFPRRQILRVGSIFQRLAT